MPTLRETINQLANKFADSIVGAIRSASLEEILAESGAAKRGPGRPPGAVTGAVAARGPGRPPGTKSKPGRLRRRSAADIAKLSDQIVALVKKHKGGISAEKIRAELDIAANEWSRPIAEALKKKKVTKKGEKRATKYFAK